MVKTNQKEHEKMQKDFRIEGYQMGHRKNVQSIASAGNALWNKSRQLNASLAQTLNQDKSRSRSGWDLNQIDSSRKKQPSITDTSPIDPAYVHAYGGNNTSQ